jgi:hypothetical protein
VHDSDWKPRYRRWYRGAYLVLNLILLLVTVLAAVSIDQGKIALVAACGRYCVRGDERTMLAGVAALAPVSNLAHMFYLVYAALLYVLLSTLLVVYGCQFANSTSHHRRLLPRSPTAFAVFNAILVVIFLGRAVYW